MDLNYIKDKEIDLFKDDVLGTLPYVDTLSEVIEKSKTPFTIGLLGSWGSGKSSIVKTLQKHFDSDKNKQVSFFIYDAWKYSKDSFRRTFILELKEFFHLDTTDAFESFYHDKQEEVKSSVKINKGFIIYFIIFLPLIVSMLFAYFSTVQNDLKALGSFFGACLTVILFILKESFIQYKISITKPKSFAPEQFEEIFDEIIEKVTAKDRTIWNWIKGLFTKQVKKVVIAVDNIDRCDRQLAIELLLTIKNFLEKENVVFLLPVDEEGLKKYFGKDSSHDSNEFLRKMFNTTLKIKTFSPGELYDFASKLNKKHKLELPATVLSLACQEYSQNPRRIIQFLNTMQTEIFLARKQEDMNLIPKGAISNNLPMLAKLIIIREEWSELYQTISDNPSLLKEIEDALRDNNLKFSEDGSKCILSFSKPMELSIEQYRFFLRRRDIEVNNLEPFFVTKDIFDDIPDKVNTLIFNQDWGGLKDLIIKKELQFGRLFDVIADKADLDVIKRHLMLTSGFNLLALIFKVGFDQDFSKELDSIYDTESFKRIKNIIDSKEIEELVYKFNPDELVNLARWLSLKKWDALSNRIINVLKKFDIGLVNQARSARLKTMKVFLNGFAELPDHIKKLRNIFTEIIISGPNSYDDLKEVLVSKDMLENLIIEDRIFVSFMHNLEQAVKEDTKKKVEILKDFNHLGFLSQKYINSYIQHIANFINSQDWNIMEFWFSASEGLIEKVDNKEALEMILNVLKNRYNFAFNTYNAGNIAEQYLRCYSSFLKASKEFYCATKAQNNEPIQWMVRFFESNRSAQVYLAVNKLFIEIINNFEPYAWPFSQNLINRFINIGNWDYQKDFAVTLNLMLNKSIENKGLSRDQISSILDQYLILVFGGKVEAREWLLQLMKNEYIKKIIIDKFGLVTELEKQKKIVEIIIETKDEELINKVVKNILSSTVHSQLRTTVEEIKQQLGNTNPRLFRSILTDFLKEFKSDEVEQYKDFIEFYISILDVLQGNEGLVIDKLKSPLASDNSDRQNFAFALLVKIEIIPPDKKGMIKELLQSIDIQKLSEESRGNIEKIKVRIK